MSHKRKAIRSDHKALFINTVFNVDQICQRYSCSGGTFLGGKIIICAFSIIISKTKILQQVSVLSSVRKPEIMNISYVCNIL